MAAAPDERRYRIPAGHDEVLLDRDSVNYMAAFARMMVGMAQPLPQVLEAFRSGEGVPYADFPPDFVEGQGDMNRTQFVNLLATEWLPAMPDVDERLRSGSARVADVACGTGWSSVAMAKAYRTPAWTDSTSIRPRSSSRARSRGRRRDRSRRLPGARRSRPGARRPLRPRDGVRGRHDMAKPVEALRAIRGCSRRAASRWSRTREVADEFTAPGDDVERVMYGWSILHCLPVGRVEQPSAETGTAMRASTFRRYAEEAGFRKVEVVPIEHDFWRFYRLEA